MYQLDKLEGEFMLGDSLRFILPVLCHDRVDFTHGKERKHSEVFLYILVGRSKEELVEVVAARHLFVNPNGVSCAFPEFLAGGSCE